MTNIGTGGFVLFVLFFLLAFAIGFFVGKKNGAKVTEDLKGEVRFLKNEVARIRRGL